MSKKVIAVDLDDVLSSYAPAFVEFNNKRWGTEFTIDQVNENWAKMWKMDYISMEKRAKILHKELFKELDHIEGSKPILQKLSKEYRLVVTTSRRKILEKDTADWLDRYFPGIFDDIKHAGIYDETHTDHTYKKTKVDICRKVGAEYLIDDQPKHCFATSKVGITSLLFGEYPWNRAEKLPRGVVRVKDWHEIARYFNV